MLDQENVPQIQQPQKDPAEVDLTQPTVRRSNRMARCTSKVLQDSTNRLSSLVGRQGR